MTGLRIENLTRHDREGLPPYYTADVVNGDDSVAVTRRWGSWQTADGRHDVKPDVAAWLQREVGKRERAEARATHGGDAWAPR